MVVDYLLNLIKKEGGGVINEDTFVVIIICSIYLYLIFGSNCRHSSDLITPYTKCKNYNV